MRRHGFGWSKKKYGDHRLHDTRRCQEPRREATWRGRIQQQSRLHREFLPCHQRPSSVPFAHHAAMILACCSHFFAWPVVFILLFLLHLISILCYFFERSENDRRLQNRPGHRVAFSCPSHLPLVHAATCSCCLGCLPISPKQLRTMTMLMVVAKQMTDWRRAC